MNCLADTACLLNTVTDFVFNAVAAIDYAGAVWFGDEWRSIGPAIHSNLDAFARMVDGVFNFESAGCSRLALLGEHHA